ncbi:hypothetical protein LJC46_08295 [Desulfovibrio sp. OttesenSCG-928-G15]|nr:hypothetical protein [Desulfovibrio sp. OttesenSCG-928-G15]
MSEKLTHWREFFKSDYFAACDLSPGEERILTIRNVGRREVPVPNSSKKDLCLVAEFVERDTKPMVLNVTNSKTLAKMYGTPHIEMWAGRKVKVYGDTTKFKGETVDCLRIRPKEPTAAMPELTPSSGEWTAAVQKMARGETSIETIRKHRLLTDQNAARLQKESASA